MTRKPPGDASASATLKPGSRGRGLEAFLIFDSLTVGPVKIEPKRLVAPYTLAWKGRQETNELIYRFEEVVFQPEDAGCQNLAAMMAAQVALNYGLFCRELVFWGPFDLTDRHFLEEMAANTAREIYVKKFLEPNPFLLDPFRHVQAVKRSSYLNAAMRFPGMDRRISPLPWRRWTVDRGRHAVLSSGGKDSLLSFALLREAGCEVHPLFVNESGRHWFTAINAYRHFAEHVPNTARVWTNADRVFSWMLRFMPFIRPDFAEVRADEYPIRLWTVAVFLFGVLPLMRKRGIGRLIVGDEFDTTNPANREGIPHYDGLFDQSRFFDETVSRYFMMKGWAVTEFSILRPLSELLIQKILLERYGDLQRFQTSCHATHAQGDRMLPCGKCEKCRRIVGMVTAMDGDPAACGYTPAQVEACLEALATMGVHQESEAAEHLAHMLTAKGLIAAGGAEKTPARANDIVLKLRFDEVCARVWDIPVDLREPLFKIFLAHAHGAVLRCGRRWIACDPFDNDLLRVSYPFEQERFGEGGGHPALPVKTGYLWGEMNWKEAAVALVERDVALLPVGAIEQHGPHLPLDVDSFDAEFLAWRVAEACSDPKPLVLPLVPFGISYHHDAFKGTVSVSNESFSQFIYDIGKSLVANGVRKLVIINGHGGNAPALHYTAQLLHRDTGLLVCVDTGETSDADLDALCQTPNDVHAGEIETSTTLAIRPHLVDMSEARERVPKFSSRYLDFSAERALSWYSRTEYISEDGVMGDPTKADAAKGALMWEIMMAHLVALVEDLKHRSLESLMENPV